MKFNKKFLISAFILAASTGFGINKSFAAAGNLPGNTFVFQFEGSGATATGSFSLDTGYNSTEALAGDFFLTFSQFQTLNLTVAGASAGNGTFTLADFNSAIFESSGALNFSTNLAGQANLFDLNFFGNAPVPSGDSRFTLVSNGGTGTEMELTCFFLQGVGICGPEESVTATLVTLATLSSSLVSSAAGVDATMANTNMLINGAHSRPLSRRVAVGKNTAWVAGDIGRDDHGSRSGSTGIAEIGAGYNFGPAQVNLTVGKTWANQNLTNNGDLDADGQYIMIEGIIPVSESHGLFATIGTYGHWGDADIQRGYINGTGAQDFSTASPDTHTWGVRARLDWENAFAVKSVDFSPYTDFSYSKSRMDGYTEAGGALPVRFDGRSDHSSELRVGLNATMPIKATKLNLVANIEAAHRFNDEGASSSGEVIGLFSFNLPGQDYQSSWLKAGLGLEGGIGNGRASLMLNGTTKSSMPSAWLAASYQLEF